MIKFACRKLGQAADLKIKDDYQWEIRAGFKPAPLGKSYT
jgi:thymidylate synthase ThyX